MLALTSSELTEFPKNGTVSRSYPKIVGCKFENPWSTFLPYNWRKAIPWMLSRDFRKKFPSPAPPLETLNAELPVKKPEFAIKTTQLELTWIGHATMLVRLDGISVITDPIFSNYCSPLKFKTFRRIRVPACTVADLPDDLGIVVISHNHYDHLDLKSVVQIHRRYGNQVTFCVPKNQRGWFLANVPGLQHDRVIDFNWWQMAKFALKEEGDFQVVSVPAQHRSSRHPFNVSRTLWCGWVVVGPSGRKFFYAGDTGYCPGFKEIGAEFGPIDLSAIPIGAYNPEWLLKSEHLHPRDAVQVHLDVRSKQSVAVHWGTFQLAGEETFEPRIELHRSVEESGLPRQSFVTLGHGETLTV